MSEALDFLRRLGVDYEPNGANYLVCASGKKVATPRLTIDVLDQAPELIVVLDAALDVCHTWRDHSYSSNRLMVQEMIQPIAELGIALAHLRILMQRLEK